jgi:hypothetical protein
VVCVECELTADKARAARLLDVDAQLSQEREAHAETKRERDALAEQVADVEMDTVRACAKTLCPGGCELDEPIVGHIGGVAQHKDRVLGGPGGSRACRAWRLRRAYPAAFVEPEREDDGNQS